MFKDFQQGNITSPNRKKIYKLSLCPNSRWKRVIAVIIYLLTLLLICVFFVVGVVFFLINNFWKLEQPFATIGYCKLFRKNPHEVLRDLPRSAGRKLKRINNY